MTIQEFYTKIQGDYEDVLLRLPNDDLVIRFVKRFLTDQTYNEFIKAVEEGDIKQSFECSHKLKGIAANLSFTKLQALVSKVCEELRSLQNPANKTLVEEITQTYNFIIEQINLL